MDEEAERQCNWRKRPKSNAKTKSSKRKSNKRGRRTGHNIGPYRDWKVDINITGEGGAQGG